MKLKEIYNQVQADQNQPQINIEEVKMRFNEQISTFKQLGEGLYNLSNYKKIAEQLSSLAESAEQYLISESDSWFDNITIKRNLKELKNYTVDFNKVSGEAQALQERMAALYEDMGVILNRYFDVPDAVKSENTINESPGDIVNMAEYQKKYTFGDISVVMAIAKKYNSDPNFKKLVDSKGGLYAAISDAEVQNSI